jgi:hypothetical protein
MIATLIRKNVTCLGRIISIALLATVSTGTLIIHSYFIWGLQPSNRFWNVNLVKVATSKLPMGRDSILPCYIETVNVQLHSMQGAAGKPHTVGSFSIVYSYSSFQNPASICLSGFQRHIPHPIVMIQAIAKT